jgi:hypothetical protein
VRHLNSSFSGSGIEEWLVYFRRSYKAFTIKILGDQSSYVVTGTHSYSRNVVVSLTLAVRDEVLSLEITTDPDASLSRQFLALYSGTIFTSGKPKGRCLVGNSYEEEKPLIRVDIKSDYRLEAYRRVPGDIVSSMLVFGVPNCEMVLEWYELLDKHRKRMLPETEPRRHFVGSCRMMRYRKDPVLEVLREISVLVAVSQFIVKDSFMSVC